MKRTEDREGYWEDVGSRLNSLPGESLWRRHCDALNISWLRTLLGRCPRGRALKTDLFDEAVHEGVCGLLADFHPGVTGIDLAFSMCGGARRKHSGLSVAAADARCLPFAGGSFDVVVSLSTLDHFSRVEEICRGLESIHRVLRPGGCLLLTLDNPWNPVICLRNAIPWRWLHRLGLVPYAVGVTVGPRRLRRLLEGVGFEVQEAGTLMHCPRAPAVAAARWAARHALPSTQEALLRLLGLFEFLGRLPTRFATGYFVTVRAVKGPR